MFTLVDNLNAFTLSRPHEAAAGATALSLREEFAALEWLNRVRHDLDAMAVLRRTALLFDEASNLARLADAEVVALLAALIAAGVVVVTVVKIVLERPQPAPQPLPPEPEPPKPPPRPKPPEKPKLGTLIVTVIDDETKQPVPNLLVGIHNGATLTMPSNAAGKSIFAGIEPGSYTVDHSDKCLQPASTSGTVTADATTAVELRVRHTHAVITIKQLDFSGNKTVEKDTEGNFGTPQWLTGRADKDQFPVACVRNTKVTFKATFSVDTAPCKAETVEVKGTATFGTLALEWKGSVTVSPSDKQVSVDLGSDRPLPNKVTMFETDDITWQMNPAGRGFTAAGSSRTLMYVTLGAPSGTPNYWTLLDISCRAAAASATDVDDEDKLAERMYAPFMTRALTRKRDGHALTYWNPTTTRATNTQQLLAAKDGSGQCGSWAETLVDMFKTHGVTSARKVLVVRTKSDWLKEKIGFLVKNWDFKTPPASSATAFTHVMGSQCVANPVPGQTSTNPPPAFFNHFIVVFKGEFYDPSYGSPRFDTQNAWEAASIAGLFASGSAGDKDHPPTPTLCGFDTKLGSARLLQFWDADANTLIP